MGVCARHRICYIGFAGLKTDLDAVESRCFQLLRPVTREAEGARDEIGVHASLVGASDQFCQVFTSQWLPTRKQDVEDTQIAGLADDALPLLCGQLTVWPS